MSIENTHNKFYMSVFVPPLNFALVEDSIYRSGHPVPINYPFLETLHLKTIIYVGDVDDNSDYVSWTSSHGINYVYIKMKSVKEPFIENDPVAITQALSKMLDTRNYPILVHSNKGKHRVGVLVGVMRSVLQGWSLAGIFDEYSKFAAGKTEADVEVSFHSNC